MEVVKAVTRDVLGGKVKAVARDVVSRKSQIGCKGCQNVPKTVGVWKIVFNPLKMTTNKRFLFT